MTWWGGHRGQSLAAAVIGLAGVAAPGASPTAATPVALAVAPATTAAWLSSRIGRSIGPPGGEVCALAIAPASTARLFAGTANGHLFVTDDGAVRWRECGTPLAPGTVLDGLAVDPRSPDVAYAAFWRPEGGGGMLRTRDGGRSWDRLAVPGAPALRAVAVSPSEPDAVYVGGPAGVWHSADRGTSWIAASGGDEPVREVESLAVDPSAPRRVYAGTRRQAYRSPDAGTTWSRIGRGMEVDRDVFAITTSPLDANVLVAGTCGFLYGSSDGGENWSVRDRGLPFEHRRVHAVAIVPLEPRQVWAGTRGGLYRSRDAARSFEPAYPGVSVSAIVTDATAGRVYAGTEETGVLASRDGGPFAESNVGLDATRVVAFDVMPGDLRVLFAARGEGPGRQSIQTSSDAGRTWSQLGEGLTFENVRFLRAVALPVPQLLVIGADGLWWRLASGGWLESFPAPPGRVAAVVVAHAGSVVLAATDTGLYRSRADALAAPGERPFANHGADWISVHEGPLSALDVRGDRFLAVASGVVVRGHVSVLLAGGLVQPVAAVGLTFAPLAVALGAEADSPVYAVSRTGLVRSADRGSSWQVVALPWPASDLRAIVVDPSEPDRVVALDARGALLRGLGGGRHWRVLDDDPWLDRAQDLRLSASVPGLALVATLGHGVRVVALGGSSPRRAPPAPAGQVRPKARAPERRR